ncbi:NHR-34 protein [Aphelenchoides avenae]|nr:NHR-34 protein [Aphelenchus avenae]
MSGKHPVRLCDGMEDLGVAPVDNYNVNVPVSVAWRRPGFISARTPAKWKPTTASTSSNFMRQYLRNIAHYFDWVSYIPELKELSDSDKELMIVGRCVPCTFLLGCYHSAVDGVEGIAMTGGAYLPYDPSRLDSNINPMAGVVEAAMKELIKPIRENMLSETEYALLRVVCFCSPVPKMSRDGSDVINKAKEKYLNALAELVHTSQPASSFSRIAQRISWLMMLLPAAERAARVDDAALAVMSLFNMAGLQGSLTWDLHVKNCYT